MTDNVVYLPWVTPPGQESSKNAQPKKPNTSSSPQPVPEVASHEGSEVSPQAVPAPVPLVPTPVRGVVEWAVPGQAPKTDRHSTPVMDDVAASGKVQSIVAVNMEDTDEDGQPVQYSDAETVSIRLEKSLAHMLSRSDQSRKELEQKLSRRYVQLVETNKLDELNTHFDLANIIEHLLDTYEQRGWLNEMNAVISAVDRAGRAGKSSGLIKRELQQKGYPSNVIDEAMAEYDHDSELEALLEVASKRISQTNDLEPAVQKRRLWAFLQRRGYSSSQIQTALTELLG